MSRLTFIGVPAAALTVLVGCAFSPVSAVPEPIPPPLLEARLASDTAAPGFGLRYELNEDGKARPVFLATTSILSDADITHARTRPGPEGITVEVLLSDAAVTRLRVATERNIGGSLALLTNGRLAGTATILQSIPRTNKVSLGLAVPPAVADSVRVRVAARWPDLPR